MGEPDRDRLGGGRQSEGRAARGIRRRRGHRGPDRQCQRAGLRAGRGSASAAIRRRRARHHRPQRPVCVACGAGPAGAPPREGPARRPRACDCHRSDARLAARRRGRPPRDRAHDRSGHPSPRPDRVVQGHSLLGRSDDQTVCGARQSKSVGRAAGCERPRDGAAGTHDERQRLVPRQLSDRDGCAAGPVDDPRRGGGGHGRRSGAGRGVQAAEVSGDARRSHWRRRARSRRHAQRHGHDLHRPAGGEREGPLAGGARGAVSAVVPLVLSGAAVRWRGGADRPRYGRH